MSEFQKVHAQCGGLGLLKKNQNKVGYYADVCRKFESWPDDGAIVAQNVEVRKSNCEKRVEIASVHQQSQRMGQMRMQVNDAEMFQMIETAEAQIQRVDLNRAKTCWEHCRKTNDMVAYSEIHIRMAKANRME